MDKTPKFIWLADPRKCPKSARGYDFDGARFTHTGDTVTFEVVAHTSIERWARGLQAQHDNDHALLAAMCAFFDPLHAALRPAK